MTSKTQGKSQKRVVIAKQFVKLKQDSKSQGGAEVCDTGESYFVISN